MRWGGVTRARERDSGPIIASRIVGRNRCSLPLCPHGDSQLTAPYGHGLLRIVTDTCVHLWRRVHMDLVRYAGCVCRSSC
nr:putative leader peptide [Streptomyces niveiscabiei]